MLKRQSLPRFLFLKGGQEMPLTDPRSDREKREAANAAQEKRRQQSIASVVNACLKKKGKYEVKIHLTCPLADSDIPEISAALKKAKHQNLHVRFASFSRNGRILVKNTKIYNDIIVSGVAP